MLETNIHSGSLAQQATGMLRRQLYTVALDQIK